jgi:tetratricopeptide (TPR) repeat protein
VLPPAQLPATLGVSGVLREISALAQVEQTRAAEAAYRAAATRWPESAVAWLGLGSLLEQREALPEAETAFRRAVAADPSLGPAWNNLAHVLSRLGKLAEARAAVARALADPGRFEPIYRRTLADIETLEDAPTPRFAR